MPWAKLPDEFHMDRRVRRAGLEAVGLYCKACSYCARYLTDGFVDDEWLREEIPHGKKRARVVGTLLEQGLFERRSGGVQVADYLRDNPSRSDLAELRRAKQEGGKKGAETRWASQNGDGSSHSSPKAPPTRPTGYGAGYGGGSGLGPSSRQKDAREREDLDSDAAIPWRVDEDATDRRLREAEAL